jgi:acyl dehydratase
MTVDQARIDLFAQATGDHQWIHVDPARAAQGPFGGTVAHGFLTLRLLPEFGAGRPSPSTTCAWASTTA